MQTACKPYPHPVTITRQYSETALPAPWKAVKSLYSTTTAFFQRRPPAQHRETPFLAVCGFPRTTHKAHAVRSWVFLNFNGPCVLLCHFLLFSIIWKIRLSSCAQVLRQTCIEVCNPIMCTCHSACMSLLMSIVGLHPELATH